jgi:hypothetical protein
MKSPNNERERHLGDQVYAKFNGSDIKLRASRIKVEDIVIYLDMETFDELQNFVRDREAAFNSTAVIDLRERYVGDGVYGRIYAKRYCGAVITLRESPKNGEDRFVYLMPKAFRALQKLAPRVWTPAKREFLARVWESADKEIKTPRG